MGEEGEDFLSGMGSIQTMGIMNALRTGDPRMDMILAMLMPFAIRFLIDLGTKLKSYMKWDWRRQNKNVERRFIVHKTTKNQWGYYNEGESDTQNTILIKAIELYLHAVIKIDLDQAYVDLTSTEDKNASVGKRQSYYYYDDSEDDESKTVVGALSKYRIVHKPLPGQWHDLGEHGKPPSPVWLRLQNTEEQEGEGTSTKKQVVRSFEFESEAGASIDTFIDTAYQWYVDELRKMEDNSRYFYELKSKRQKANDDEESVKGVSYSRYRLSDEKTFGSLFFEQKNSLLKLVDHFQNRSGKYCVQGYPHKLGVLLHGPPGTGKTSMIKALANYTGRSIINVPLARVSTNAELMSIFFDPRKHVTGESVPVKLGFKDVIFVMEDVDAATKIVKRRDGKKHDSPQLMPDDVPLPKPLWHMLLENQGQQDDCKQLVTLLIEKSERLKAEAVRPEILLAAAQRITALPGLGLVGEATGNAAVERIGKDALASANKMQENQDSVGNVVARLARTILNLLEQGTPIDETFEDELLGNAPTISFLNSPEEDSDGDGNDTDSTSDDSATLLMASLTDKLDKKEGSKSDSSDSKTEKKDLLSLMRPSPYSFAGDDDLNLSGLLNVLDGVVDSPGRIVIMTTNHIEQLDPALIRPGRIDKKLLLGHMRGVDVVSMVEHYFQTSLTAEQRHRVEVTVGKDDKLHLMLTPAVVEQLIAEFEEVDDMVQALEDRARPTQRRRLKCNLA